MDREGFIKALEREDMLIYGTTYESNFRRLQALKKHRDTEDSIVKSLETIAECMVKSNEMAREALKKGNQLYGANMAMINENTKTTNTKTPLEQKFTEEILEGLGGT